MSANQNVIQSKNLFQMSLPVLHKQGFQTAERNQWRANKLPSLSCTRTARPKLKQLSQVKYYAATTDLWSSWTTKPYISLTVHFINEDFKLKTAFPHPGFPPHHYDSICLSLFWGFTLYNTQMGHWSPWWGTMCEGEDTSWTLWKCNRKIHVCAFIHFKMGKNGFWP